MESNASWPSHEVGWLGARPGSACGPELSCPPGKLHPSGQQSSCPPFMAVMQPSQYRCGDQRDPAVEVGRALGRNRSVTFYALVRASHVRG